MQIDQDNVVFPMILSTVTQGDLITQVPTDTRDDIAG